MNPPQAAQIDCEPKSMASQLLNIFFRIANAGKADYSGENMVMRWSWLWAWGRRRHKLVEVVMYTRQGCHLCDDAWKMLEDLRQRNRLHLTQVDVDDAPELQQRYGNRVPVLVIEGKERMWGAINRVLLERQIRALT
jgi:glutaredoxin